MEGSTNESKKKRGGIKRLGKCKICDDKANHHIHYGSITCYSCRAFFRRITVSAAHKDSFFKNQSLHVHDRLLHHLFSDKFILQEKENAVSVQQCR